MQKYTYIYIQYIHPVYICIFLHESTDDNATLSNRNTDAMITDAVINDAVTKIHEGRHKKTSLTTYLLLTLLQGFERVVQGLHVRGCWRPNINFIF